MLATSMNLAIAIIEGKIRAMRSIVRGSSITDLKDLGPSTRRLRVAVEKREKEAVRDAFYEVLTQTASLEPPLEVSSLSPEEAFLRGVYAVETILDSTFVCEEDEPEQLEEL